MNARTVREIKNLARESYNARRNQGQKRIARINGNLLIIKMTHNARAVNNVFNRAYREFENKKNRTNTVVRNAAHRFKMGPRIALFMKSNFYKNLPLNMQLKILKNIRTR
jgi:hypothetical protein